jgi:hypothetical protein
VLGLMTGAALHAGDAAVVERRRPKSARAGRLSPRRGKFVLVFQAAGTSGDFRDLDQGFDAHADRSRERFRLP